MERLQYDVGDIVKLKKPHPCGSQEWEILRVGADFRMKCHKSYDAEYMLHAEGVPTCTCGGTIKPDVVLYEEGLDDYTLRKSVEYISQAEVLIIGGTSLVVYPAAGLIDYFRGKHLVVINKSVTSRDKNADLVIQDSIGKVFESIEIQ